VELFIIYKALAVDRIEPENEIEVKSKYFWKTIFSQPFEEGTALATISIYPQQYL
jgi:hypothetical protein